MITETTKKRIRLNEGYNKKLYRDTSQYSGFEGKPGKITIGIGYNIDDRGLPDEVIEKLFNDDVTNTTIDVTQKIPWSAMLNDARRGVLVEMAFNLKGGVQGLLAFKGMLGAMQRGAFDEAAGHLRDSLLYKQLTKRYEPIAKILETGKEI